jgi:hypothetical protein
MEQACCLAQARGKDFAEVATCREAAEYLTGGDAAKLCDFDVNIANTEYNPKADYDVEDYEGKDGDLTKAVAELVQLGNAGDAPDGKRGALLKAADMIACFYGLDSGFVVAES